MQPFISMTALYVVALAVTSFNWWSYKRVNNKQADINQMSLQSLTPDYMLHHFLWNLPAQMCVSVRCGDTSNNNTYKRLLQPYNGAETVLWVQENIWDYYSKCHFVLLPSVRFNKCPDFRDLTVECASSSCRLFSTVSELPPGDHVLSSVLMGLILSLRRLWKL